MILIRHGQSVFNRVYSESRRDPGIRDPHLTALGRKQAIALARALQAPNLRRLITSPCTRALKTAEIVAAGLGLPISVEALIAERFAFICDICSRLACFARAGPHRVRSSAGSLVAFRRGLGLRLLWSHIGALSRP
jgi:hypothetical protein